MTRHYNCSPIQLHIGINQCFKNNNHIKNISTIAQPRNIPENGQNIHENSLYLFAKEHKISNIDDWYNITTQQIQRNKLGISNFRI